jgi:hypothetical protein
MTLWLRSAIVPSACHTLESHISTKDLLLLFCAGGSRVALFYGYKVYRLYKCYVYCLQMKCCSDVVGMCGILGTSGSEFSNLIRVSHEILCDVTLCGGNFNTRQPF